MERRISIDRDVMGGVPCVAGTRIPVTTILGLLGDGVTTTELLTDYYPHLTIDGVLACLRYAASRIDKDVSLEPRP